MRVATVALVLIALCISILPMAAPAATLAEYTSMLNDLRTELKAKVPDAGDTQAVNRFIASDKLDARLAKYVVIMEATPQGLADFAAKGKTEAALIDKLLGDSDLMLQMVVADGARDGKYGQAMKIYADIQKASRKASKGVLQRLACAIALEHAVPISQRNPTAETDAPATVDPVKRYLNYEKALEDGELDPAFDRLDTFNLRFVVDGNEPDWTLEWGREMLRNYRPDHICNDNYGWRYVNTVATEVRYGSGDVKYDRPELQFFQNIIMNGGVCGRRAFFGRFILRGFGIPTTARPSRGHAALCHWTPKGWVVNLGGGWGAGWTKTAYKKDKDFLATTQARMYPKEYMKVKRAHWIGDVLGEARTYGENAGAPAPWNAIALKTQRKIINESNTETLAALGAELGESNEQTAAQKVMSTPISPRDKEITYGKNGVITIPAAAYSKPSGKSRDVSPMKSFTGGLQVFLPRFARQGVTVMRGGAWRGGADGCRSGWRMPSSGYGRYNNWGFRVAATPEGGKTPGELKLDLGDGVTLALVYVKPGTFTMGGSFTKSEKWHACETPKHEVTLTRGYYIGKYEVTQEQFQKLMGSNPSKANKDPKAPADTISEGDAVAFCGKVAERTGMDVRLPTEAEWEYACRAGTSTKYFFGENADKLGDYAWYDKNDGGSSHPVGQKKPNPWGLYDILGNVCERVSDIYDKNYYAKSPKEDPTGLIQGVMSKMEYTVTAPKAGKYALGANVVTVNYDQKLNISANNGDMVTMTMPYTCGMWKDSEAVTLTLKEGENTLKLYRDNPPQYGMAIKSFTLKPM